MWSSNNNNNNNNNNHPPLSISGVYLFFTLLLTTLTLSNNASGLKLFTHPHGRIHRLTGLFHLLWLLYGALFLINDYHHTQNENNDWHRKCLVYDITLGTSGIITTLTAASSFPHKHIHNRPGESGTLSNAAIVTQGEMVEHSFYQGVNLRFGMLVLVTLPWAIRKRFPVNSFSANWRRKNVEMNKNNRHHDKNGGIRVGTEKESKYLWLINGMYRFKKWQYVFYKHMILHGLNISVASSYQSYKNDTTSLPLPLTPQWRIFWLLLNTSYVMEFFLQSLVKRQVLSQKFMMVLNALLMISASIASMESNVLGQVKVEAALISLFLNFYNRGHDVLNTMVTFIIVHFGNKVIRI
ncbi:hypothetical protein QTG54_009977 [Skeletonema marinoi]|uniref:Uncharacterized protein n=1 Tax=Skeletonema marinoi TaxID=267567 RepID=A0AAD8Y4E7_9STRA|nr:hypothetical protein QTG54_009977 [Skeletonema marinoi]